ncbi:MAG: transposon-encoded TnpW family protein [Oscillospiraceae bacterium]|nr:transposon-encoded TnpW family protein [Oscillospiraceae bacterium]
MSAVQIELTEKQWEIVEEIWAKVEQETAYLATLSKEQRLAWFREHQYPHPISFEREIGGTVYTVNAHFSKEAETADGKVNRILKQNITL